MKVPADALFVAADEPLLVFSSASEAQTWMEAIDVQDGVYPAAYGLKGEPYYITAVDDLVYVERADQPPEPDALRQLLLRYLEATGRSALETATLDELVETAWTICGSYT